MIVMPRGSPWAEPLKMGAPASIMTPCEVRISPRTGLPAARAARQGKSSGRADRAANSIASGAPEAQSRATEKTYFPCMSTSNSTLLLSGAIASGVE